MMRTKDRQPWRLARTMMWALFILAVVMAWMGTGVGRAESSTWICHYPDSQEPFLLSVDPDALKGHLDHGDFMMAPWDRCVVASERPAPVFFPLVQR